MRRARHALRSVPWLLPLLALAIAAVMLIVLGSVGGRLAPSVPTAQPAPTAVASSGVQALPPSTPVPINYTFYEWRNADFQKLYPEAGPIGSLYVLPWIGIHVNDNQFDWRAIDDYLAAASNMTVTLDDGSVISKPVILEIEDNESAIPTNAVYAPFPPLTPESMMVLFADFTPAWVRDRIRQPIDPITWVTSLTPTQVETLTTDLGSYMAIGRLGSSPCGYPIAVFAPKYNNPQWLAAYKQMVYALGARYDRDPRLTAVIFGPGIDQEYGQPTKPVFDCDVKSMLYEQTGMTEREYLEIAVKAGPLNDMADWYRDAFPTKPVYLQFTSAGKIMIDTLDADNHVPPIGLKQATLIEDNYNQWQSDGNGTIQLMMRYSMTHPIAWENAHSYTGPSPLDKQIRYFTLLAGLTSFPDFMDFIGGWHVDKYTYETGMFDFQRKYLGRTLTTTDEIWVAMRETKAWDTSGGAIKYGGWRGDFTYGLYRPAGVPASATRIITSAQLAQAPFFLSYPITTEIYSWQARRTDTASGDPYMSFAADHRWEYWGKVPFSKSSAGVWYDITLKYIDLGSDPLSIEYVDYEGITRTRTIRKRNSREWVTTTVTLSDAYLHGQFPGETDFRLDAVSGGGGVDEIVHMVMVKGHLGTAPTPTPLTVRPTRTPVPLYEQRVNAGGPQYADLFGTVWLADQAYQTGSWGYVGGSPYTAVRTVEDAADPPLHSTERYWQEPGGYVFDAPNGPYDVELRFAETLRDGKDQRLFDITIEGVTVAKNFDIFTAAGGVYKGIIRHFQTVVADGQLNIAFTAFRDTAKVDAVHVTYIRPELLATPAPSPTATAPAGVITPRSTPSATPTATPTATPPAPTRTPTVTPTLTVDQWLSQFEERYRRLDEAVQELLRALGIP